MICRNLNYISSPYDKRDYKAVSENIASLPLVVDLIQYCSPVKDQGSEGSCTAFSTIAALEFIGKKNNIDLSLSEQFTYYATRVNIANGPPIQDSGAYIRDAVKSTVHYGTCLETIWPYSNLFNIAPSTNAYAEALKHTSIIYSSVVDNNIISIKSMLSSGIPIIIGFSCYSNIFTDNVTSSGIIPLSNNNVVGGHAVLLIGYNESTKLFKFKNSWGTSWGENGYGYLSYDYFSKNISEAWCISTETDNNVLISIGITITDPSIKQNLLNNQIISILNDIITNISIASDKSKMSSYFTKLQEQNQENRKLSNLISNINMSFDMMEIIN